MKKKQDGVALNASTTSTKSKKDSRIRRQNIEAIIRAAEDEFVSHGYKGATIQAVADKAGLPKANVLYYFKRKSDLYYEVLAGILDLWNSSFDHVTADDDPAEAIANYIRSKMELSRLYPKASKIYASEIIHGAPYLSQYLKQTHADWTNQRAKVIQSWIEQGRMKAIDPHHLLFLIWGATQHYADFSAQTSKVLGREMDQTEFDLATEMMIEIILSGCGIETSRILNKTLNKKREPEC
ncbi:TetR/AcrR family transcriptional regulator [Gynuella sunshinyii]|uniref:Transcriptional regulator n=1 Tax=Gynuella sunshinyii YC6258 TaxID=1445510 RepID=A0A0C5W209_9GAMM|nr:TetR/AcrR family transcriptional regulator [Gynuella sunshinyii]AJQ96699.1 transcriptional regulator [Gynuella sunshinyii YC6258]